MCPHRRASGRRPRPRQAAHQRGVDLIFSFCDVDTEPITRRPAWRTSKNKAPTSIHDSDDLVAAPLEYHSSASFVSMKMARSQTLTQLREVVSVSPSEMMEAEARKTKRMTAAGVGKARRTGARHHPAVRLPGSI